MGKRNYSYIEVKEALRKALETSLQLQYEDEIHEEFDIRIFLEHDKAYIGIRLATKPLHRRSYKVATTKATLRADIAYCMAYLAGIKNNDKVLDPMCGSGSILIEASTFGVVELFGGDINNEAVLATKRNIEAFNLNINANIHNWDATKLPLENRSIDKIICNLPFGKQIEVDDINKFYKNLITEFSRVIRLGGKIVLLTNCPYLEDFIPLAFTLNQKIETNLNGEVVFLSVYDIKQ